uniref:Uncharacterized protein n=1 Tax=Salix viminalis TaxID=40686 RepID=A0A6N2L9C6_SALVM
MRKKLDTRFPAEVVADEDNDSDEECNRSRTHETTQTSSSGSGRGKGRGRGRGGAREPWRGRKLHRMGNLKMIQTL